MTDEASRAEMQRLGLEHALADKIDREFLGDMEHTDMDYRLSYVFGRAERGLAIVEYQHKVGFLASKYCINLSLIEEHSETQDWTREDWDNFYAGFNDEKEGEVDSEDE